MRLHYPLPIENVLYYMLHLPLVQHSHIQKQFLTLVPQSVGFSDHGK